MTSTGILIEIDGPLFDTHRLRVDALHSALTAEGADVQHEAVAAAHAGVPASIAVGLLQHITSLDDTARELVLLRAARAIEAELERGAPSFDTDARDAIEAVAADFPIAVVTRATRAEAQRMLEQASLDACVRAIRSIAGLPATDHAATWAEAAVHLRTDRAVAVAPPPMLDAARQAGLLTVAVGDGEAASAHRADGMLAALAKLQPAFILTLSRSLPASGHTS